MNIELPNLVDAYQEKRNERLAADRAAAKLKEEEGVIKEQIIRMMQEARLKVAGSHNATVKLHEKMKPVATDWGAVYKFIMETNGFDLLQKRLTQEAVQLRWDEGVEIPGVKTFPVLELSISK